MKYVYIYGLVDPRTGLICYVGKSIRPEARLLQHIKDCLKDETSAKNLWIQGLIDDEMKPDMRILETVDSPELATEREWYWIQHYRQNGETFNISPASTGNRVVAKKLPRKDRYDGAYMTTELLGHPLYLDDLWEQRQKEEGYPTGEDLEILMEIHTLVLMSFHGHAHDDIDVNYIRRWYESKVEPELRTLC